MGLSTSTLFDVFGTTGTSLYGISLTPQIYRGHMRKSLRDVSYAYPIQAMAGLVLMLIYFVHYSLWAVVPTMIFHLIQLGYLLVEKAYFAKVTSRQVELELDNLGSNLLLEENVS